MPPEVITEEADLLRKQIATARILLLIVAVATLLSALLLLPTLSYPYTILNIGITSAVAAVYFMLAIWTKKKPYSAILTGLLLLLLIVLFDIFLNPFGPYSRWQSKTLSILLLCIGIGDSKDAQRKMQAPAAPSTPAAPPAPPTLPQPPTAPNPAAPSSPPSPTP